jgi:flagellar hook-basal body complex protein FliE
MNPIAPISPVVVGSERAPSVSRAAEGPAFGDLLSGAIEQARDREKTAADMSAGFANGDPSVGIHEVMIASEKANLSLRYAVTLKNKLLDAYRELMATPV